MKRPNAWNAILGSGLVLAGAAALSLSVSAAESDEVFNREVKVEKLSDLRDGETRSFGEGEHKVEATRHGDEVTIAMHGREASRVRNLTCNLTSDLCTVTTMSGKDARTMVMVNRRKDGDGKAEVTAQKIVLAGGAHGGGTVVIEGAGDGGGTEVIENLDDLHGFPGLLHLDDDGDHVLLRCPQGDTTMRLTTDEAKGGTYRCPKHNEELKEVKGERHLVRIIHRGDEPAAEKK